MQTVNLNAFTELLATTYGLTPNDIDMDRISGYLSAGESPEDLIEWLGEKFHLTALDASDNN